MAWAPVDGELFISWSRGPMVARCQLQSAWLLVAYREMQIVGVNLPDAPAFNVDLWRTLSEGA